MIEINLNPERDTSASVPRPAPDRQEASKSAPNPRRGRHWVPTVLCLLGGILVAGHRAVDQHLKYRLKDQAAELDAMAQDSLVVARRALEIEAWVAAMTEHAERILHLTSLDEQRSQWSELVYVVAHRVPSGVRLARLQTVLSDAPAPLGLEIRGLAPNLETVLLYLNSLADEEVLDGVELLQIEGRAPHLNFAARVRPRRSQVAMEGP
jgi:hypothetical protein